MLERVALLLSQARGAYQREQFDIALAYFQRARELDPHSPEALLGSGEVASYLGRRNEAIESFLTLADLYTQAGMLEVAAEVVERVLELDRTQPLARRFRQFIHERLRRPTLNVERDPTTIDGSAEAKSVAVPSPALAEPPSDRSLAQLVLWADEDSSVKPESTAIVNNRLDELLGELGQAARPITDILADAATPTAIADRPDQDGFGDVATRAAPAGLMEDLASGQDGADDPFVAETVLGDVARLRKDTAGFSEATEVDPPLDTAIGSGQIEVGGWDFDTTAAVMAENDRVKPRLSLDDVEWDENDFPRYDEAKHNSSMVDASRTIAIDGEGAVAALASLMAVSPLLAVLDIEDCQTLLEYSEVTQYFEGQEVFTEGASGSSLFLLATGQAAVERGVHGHASRRVASISAGNFFGEGSLLADSPRSSTVRVLEDSLVLELDRALVQTLVAAKPRVLTVLTRFLRARLLSTLMMDSPLFHRLPSSERSDLAPLIHLHKLVPDQTVAQRGQVLTGFCTVMTGTLKRIDVAEGTGTQVFGNLGPGSAFGSRSLYGEPSLSTISAETGCWLLRLPTSDLRALVERHPELIETLAEVETR